MGQFVMTISALKIDMCCKELSDVLGDININATGFDLQWNRIRQIEDHAVDYLFLLVSQPR